VHLQSLNVVIGLQSGFPMQQIASAHVGGQLLTLEGKPCSHGGSLTINGTKNHAKSL